MEKYDHYDYEKLTADIKRLRYEHPELSIGSIGKSELGRDLYYIKLGCGAKSVFCNATHHALEWITTPILIKFAEDYMKAYACGKSLYGFSPRELFNKVSIYLVPMVNPDGVDLVLNGLPQDNPNYDNLLAWNGGSDDFSTKWQANNNGVDLNHNYDALWAVGKAAEPENGIFGPGPTRYSGEFPESESESRAVANFSRSVNFDLVIALHSQGAVIYWTFDSINPPNSYAIGKKLEKASGYALDLTEGMASYSGYKDWFMQEFNNPGYTIEVGLGENPLPISQFDEIYKRVCPALLTAAESVIN
ncbi:MAG: M14 family metallocarboxypeptidase [Oscillospiraceae bacterium]|nr:M14 family metallocarboxypeptidase [Oscillospiraceae bacterium]